MKPTDKDLKQSTTEAIKAIIVCLIKIKQTNFNPTEKEMLTKVIRDLQRANLSLHTNYNNTKSGLILNPLTWYTPTQSVKLHSEELRSAYGEFINAEKYQYEQLEQAFDYLIAQLSNH